MSGDPSTTLDSLELYSDICAAKATASHAQSPELEVWDIESFRRPGERTIPEVCCVHNGRERAEMGQERFSGGVPEGGPRGGYGKEGRISSLRAPLISHERG